MLCVLAVLCHPLSVSSQEAEGIVRLEETVVTATRDREEIGNIPAHVTVITADDIQESGATTLVDVLQHVEGIHIKSYSNPGNVAIDLRGFGRDNPFGKTLIMLDGRKLNRPDMSSVNWLQVPLNNVERVEVIRGANSVLYGDAAVAGVINIITKKGTKVPEVNASFVAGSYGLHDERVGITGSSDRLSYALMGENNKTFGYRQRTKYSVKGGGFQVGYDFSDYLAADLGVSFLRTGFDLPGSLTKAQFDADPRQAANLRDYNQEEYSNVHAVIDSVLGDFGNLVVGLDYGFKDIEATMNSNWAPNKYNQMDMDTYGITPKYVLDRELFGFDNKLIAGMDFYHETYDVGKYSDEARNTQTHTVDMERQSLGYYVRDEIILWDRFIVALGYRSERTTITGTQTTLPGTVDFDAEKVHKGSAFETALTVVVAERSKVYAKYATVYKIPFIDEQASYSGWGVNTFYTDIEKEKGDSYEIGTQFYPVKDLMIGLSLYRIDMEDEIIYSNSDSRNRNFDETRHDGIEAEFSYTCGTWFELFGNVSYHEATVEAGQYNEKEIPLVPTRMANAGAKIYLPGSFVLEPKIKYVSDSYQGGDNNNTSEKLDGYTLYDLFLYFKPEGDEVQLQAFCGIENLFDKKYSTTNYYGGYYPEAGITWKGGLSFHF